MARTLLPRRRSTRARTPCRRARSWAGVAAVVAMLAVAGSVEIGVEASAATTQAVVNGGFEAGLSSWTRSGRTVSSSKAHGGMVSARVGGPQPAEGTSWLSTTVAVPREGGVLNLWYRIVCPDAAARDWVRVTILDTTTRTTRTILPRTCTNTGSWVRLSTDVTASSSHTVRLTLLSHDDGRPGSATYALFDDVTLTRPDFALSTASSTLGVAAGGTTSTVVSTVRTVGGAQPVKLSVAGLPVGVTATWSPTVVNAGEASTLTLGAASSAPGRSTTLTLSGIGRSRTRSTTVALTVTPAPLSVRVVGNRLVDQRGDAIRLLGVNRPGMDARIGGNSCLTTQDFADVSAMRAWRINAVRIPLNQDCWLGIKGIDGLTAAAYRAGVVRYVGALHQHGMYAILDLHRSAPGSIPATAMQPMPDMEHSVPFWSSVASTFASDPAVLFDLFNEPHLADVMPAGADYWRCWRSGCTLRVAYAQVNGQREAIDMTWEAAGMQDLIDAVRQTGATQPVMLEGLGFGNRLSADSTGPISWLVNKPNDPAGQLVASPHVYDEPEGCVTIACWKQQYAPVALLYPVVTGELGQADCAHDFIDRYMTFADTVGISYLAWEWSPETACVPGRSYGLITNWSGTPTTHGAGFRSHLANAAVP